MEAKINTIYENQTFFDRYNASVLGSSFLLFVFFLLVSYTYVQRHITPIRANWTQERCSPSVMPFAGFINAPRGKDKFSFTAENFNYCIKSIVKDMAGLAVLPIEASVNIINDTFKAIEEAINEIRKIISEVRTGSEDITRNIMNRLLSILVPFQKLVIVAKDAMMKTHGILYTGLYTAMASMLTLLSALFNIVNFIKAFLIAAAAAIAAMWLIPFVGFEMALAATATVTVISIPFGLLLKTMGNIEKKTGVRPSCFKGNTLIRGLNNVLYTIDAIPVGTNLMCGGTVTAVLKLDARHETMYSLGNVTVSGTHKVHHNGSWIYVKEHPDSISLSNFTDKYIYCLNTTKKKFAAGDYVFMDWDEIERNMDLTKYNCSKVEDLFNTTENGFHPETCVDILGKGSVAMNKVEVGDRLRSGERITGVVTILNNKQLFDYSIFTGTLGLSRIQNLGKYKNKKASEKRCKILNHLLTDRGSFHIKEQKLKDYNWNIDFYTS